MASNARDVEIVKDAGGYGFNLSRIADVHFIRVVEEGSAADKAGLKVPDQILKVNGASIIGVGHGDLVALIKQGGARLRMQVQLLSEAQIQALAASAGTPQQRAAQVSTANELPLAIQESMDAKPIWSGSVPLIAAHQQDLPPLKVVTIRKPPGGGFGFNLSRVNNQHLVRVVTPGGAADLAGARPGDHVIKVNETYVQNGSHAQVVELIKQAGNVVELQVAPNPKGDEAQAAFAADPILNSQVQPLAKTNEERMAEARRQAEEDWQSRRADLKRQQEEERERIRRDVFEQEKRRLQTELQRARAEATQAGKTKGSAQTAAQAIATAREYKDMQEVLDAIDANSRAELADRHKAPISEEGYDRELTELRRALELAVLDDELYQVQATEWRRFEEDCKKRRQEEETEDSKRHAELQSARQQDLALMQDKQKRMTEKLEAAREKREKEIEEKRRANEERKKRELEAARKRAEAVQRNAKAREEQRRVDAAQSERRQRLEEEARQVRAQQDKEMAARNAKLQEQTATEQAKMAQEGTFFGVPLVKRQTPAFKAPDSSHPMIKQMSKQRASGVKIPLVAGMKDTRM
eukprot:m.79138 g.79138  ORF g.79138 m.79138 type:complete len:582 (-) comp14509_c0_seq1:51-1796(-)